MFGVVQDAHKPRHRAPDRWQGSVPAAGADATEMGRARQKALGPRVIVFGVGPGVALLTHGAVFAPAGSQHR